MFFSGYCQDFPFISGFQQFDCDVLSGVFLVFILFGLLEFLGSVVCCLWLILKILSSNTLSVLYLLSFWYCKYMSIRLFDVIPCLLDDMFFIFLTLFFLCDSAWIISIGLFSNSLVLFFSIVSSLLINLWEVFCHRYVCVNIYIYAFIYTRIPIRFLFIVSISLQKFPICECMLSTFFTKAFNTSIVIILTSLSV